MTNEERDKRMDEFFSTTEASLHMWSPEGLQRRDAIRECDRKARAWDELEKQLDDCKLTTHMTKNIQNLMSELLAPPKPKSKLERLKEFVDSKIKGYPSFPPMIRHSEIMDEILRLEQEPD
jgi:hypothetical protein